SVKLGAGFTNPLAIVREIYYRNVKGVVLFNRFYPTDIDIEKLTVKAGDIFSHSSELANVLRWTAFVSGSLPLIDVAVSTGVHTGADAVKAMLAGASAVEIASVVYEKGLDVVGEINAFIGDWMCRHDFQTTRDFIGRMNAKNIPNPMLYERTQFMKYYSNHE
ncbi:MAG: diguanylate cyclase, partial [Rikenellaceae bacterium]|nr:diguanylate cyclase [Rikenellaceae bacterium]